MSTYNRAVSLLRTADPTRDYWAISARISRQLHLQLSEAMRLRASNPAATVFLTTRGGDADGGYRIGRCLRHHYGRVRVVVPSMCKSAGTLIAIAADEIGIGDYGELGPLDIQVLKGSELQEQSSGLDITEALGSVTLQIRNTFHEVLREARTMGLSTKVSADFAAKISSAVAAPLLSQVDPLRLGELQRATRIAAEYGERLNGHSQNLKPDALLSLIHNYPSHGFVIDRKEATSLFERVSGLNEAEQAFVDATWNFFREPGNFLPEFVDFAPDPNNTSPGNEHERIQKEGTGADATGSAEDGGAEHTDAGAESLRVRASGGFASTLAVVSAAADTA